MANLYSLYSLALYRYCLSSRRPKQYPALHTTPKLTNTASNTKKV